MGDSSVSCVLSGMSMTTERAGLIALAPVPYSAPTRKNPGIKHGTRVTNGDSGTLLPVLLPIFGRMNGYGGLTDIEKDANTALLEAQFRMPITELVDVINTGGRPRAMVRAARRVARGTHVFGSDAKHMIWDGRLYGCYFSREIWDRFTNGYSYVRPANGGPASSVWDLYMVNARALLGMGFQYQGEELDAARAQLGEIDGKRFVHRYTHPSMPGVVAWSDQHTHTHFAVNGVQLGPSCFRLSDVQSALASKGKSFPESAVLWAKTTPTMVFLLKGARDELREQRRQLRQHAEYLRNNPELTFRVGAVDGAGTPTFCDGRSHVKVHDGVLLEPCTNHRLCEKRSEVATEVARSVLKHTFPSWVIPTLRKMGWDVHVRKEYAKPMGDSILTIFAPEMLHVYGKKLLEKELLPLTARLAEFSRSMLACNRLYLPTERGHQYGHLYLQRDLARATFDILDRRIKARG